MTRDQISELLLQRGVFPTSQRLDVGEVILSRPQHLSAEQIIGEMRKAGSRVSKATVYNTLNLFRERGLLTTVEVDPSRQFYDSTIERHHHFYNVETGELIDIPEEALKLEVNAPLPQGTEQAGVEVVIKVRGAGAR
ncbi:MAG TPA: Fur family transcriptional regulator [Gammaproteobacteria bacterium]|nr:Fur family transcriptional regulator [Gammaproteobacteria bacterium]